MNTNPLNFDKNETPAPSLLNSSDTIAEKNNEQNLNFVTVYSKQYGEIFELIDKFSIKLETNKKTLSDCLTSEAALRKIIKQKNIEKEQLIQCIDKAKRFSNYSDDMGEYITTKKNHYGDSSAFDGLKQDLNLYLGEINNLQNRLINLIDERQNLENEINETQKKIANYQICLSFCSHNEYLDMRELRIALNLHEFKAIMLTDLPLETWHMTNLIETLIKNGEHITHIDFSNCRLKKSHIDLIIHLINMNKLICLDLSSNSLDDDDFESIGQALVNNSSLQWLSVTNNLITENSLLKFSNLLKENSTLACIKVGNNWIHMGDSYVQEISKKLRKNFPKRELDISQNFVTLTKALISNGIFRSTIDVTNSYIEPEKKINRANARVYLLAKKQINSDHALLLVERMKSTGQLSIVRLELFINPQTKKGEISIKEWDPKEKPELLEKYKFISWPIFTDKAKQLIFNIKDERDQQIGYSKLGSMGTTNCFTWAVKHLQKVGIKDIDITLLVPNIPSQRVNPIIHQPRF